MKSLTEILLLKSNNWRSDKPHQQRFYVDNYQNRKLHRVGKPISGIQGKENNEEPDKQPKEYESRGYKQTPEFRELQKRSLQLPDATVRGFHNGSKEPDEGIRKLLRRVLGGQLGSISHRDGIDVQLLTSEKHPEVKFEIQAGVNPELFHDTFEIVKQYLYSGDAVDLHDDYSECKCYLSKDGMSGFAIEPDGNLVSVFSLQKGFLSTCGKYIVEQGAKRLDCFESKKQNLPKIYKKTLGFSVAAKLDFNYDIIKEDKGKDYADYFVETYGEAPVLFMYAGDDAVKTEHYNKDQYDLAVAYQQTAVKRVSNENAGGDIQKSFFSLEDIWLLKSFKYLRKIPLGNGKYHYIYKEPFDKKKREGGFGEIFEGYEGKPHEAFDKLMQEGRGQCQNVMTIPMPIFEKTPKGWRKKRDSEGNVILADTSIDLIYGDDKTGLKHILERHYVEIDDFHSIENAKEQLIGSLTNLQTNKGTAYSRLNKDNSKKIEVIDKDNNNKLVFVIQVERGEDVDNYGNKKEVQVYRHFIMTNFNKTLHSDLKINSEEERAKRQVILDKYVGKIKTEG